jgi:LCP family protein required for cell wall assembly
MKVTEPPRLARSMAKRFAGAAVVIVVLTATATVTTGLIELRGLNRALSSGNKAIAIPEITPDQAGEPQTILLIGSDTRLAERRAGVKWGNSDTMILARLDPHSKANALLSVPRDLKVEIHMPNGGIRTDKINQAYALGGPRLAIKTIKQVLGIDVNHVINVNFKAFKAGVNRVGCVYADVDRRYFNDNPAYAEIDVRPGYQKMCGQQALDYVRFRHEDNDLVRSARQQDFLRQAKDQVGVRRILEDRQGFARLFAHYAQTDIRGSQEILRLLTLVAFSAGHPIREVHFRTNIGPSYVVSTQRQIDETVNEFLNVRSSTGPRGTIQPTGTTPQRARRRALPKEPLGLENARHYGEDQAIAAGSEAGFPILFPRLRVAGSVYVDVPRVYTLEDESGRPHSAYRMVLRKGFVGEYYGIQGTTWMDPPILQHPDETRRFGARTFQLYYDGDRLRLVALKTPKAVYWVSNTLLLSVGNRQMLAIANSLQPLGR